METNNSNKVSVADLNIKGDVIVRANPETGSILTVRKNPDWSSIRVESAVIVNNEKGLLALQKRVAFVRMQTAVAEALIAQNQLKEGKPLPVKGKIVVKESLEPFYEGQEAKINPTTMEIVTFMNQPVYRITYFQSGDSAHDELVADWFAKSQSNLEVEEIQEEIPNAQHA
jgi:hypothetical protein